MVPVAREMPGEVGRLGGQGRHFGIRQNVSRQHSESPRHQAHLATRPPRPEARHLGEMPSGFLCAVSMQTGSTVGWSHHPVQFYLVCLLVELGLFLHK